MATRKIPSYQEKRILEDLILGRIDNVPNTDGVATWAEGWSAERVAEYADIDGINKGHVERLIQQLGFKILPADSEVAILTRRVAELEARLAKYEEPSVSASSATEELEVNAWR